MPTAAFRKIRQISIIIVVFIIVFLPLVGRRFGRSRIHNKQRQSIKPSVVLNDGEALASAALGGLGIIQAPSYLVSEDIAAGRLQAVLANYTDDRGSVSLVWPPMSARAPKVRAFIDFMAERVFQKLY